MEMITHVDTMALDTFIALSILGLVSLAAYLMDQAIQRHETRKRTIARRLYDSVSHRRGGK